MGRKIRIEPLFCLAAAAAVLLIPLRWLAAWVIATCVHELFHILALVTMGCPVHCITVCPNGMSIYTEDMPVYKELICAVAGPFGSFCLLLLSRWLPYVAICGFIQGGYNLLPLHSMDGGRIVSCLLRTGLEDSTAEKMRNYIHWCVIGGLLVLGLYCLIFQSLGPLPLLFALFIAVRTGKIPCKTMDKQVQ